RLTVVGGVVSQISADAGDDAFEGPARMVDASVSYGASGGGVFDARTGELIGIIESYRTARVGGTPPQVIEVPVPGETTLVSSSAIVRLMKSSDVPAEAPTQQRGRSQRHCPPRCVLTRLLDFDVRRDVLPVAILEGHLHLTALSETFDGHTVGHGDAHSIVEHHGPVRRVERLDLAFHFSSPGADHREHQ